MDQPAQGLNELMKPTGATSSADEPVIHVIPEKFYGLALRKKVPPVAPTPATPPTAPGAPKPPEPPGPPVAPKPKKKSGGNTVLIIAILLIVLLVGGGAAALFLLGPKPAKNPTPVVNTAPKGPICGDSKCEPPETYQTCPSDCPAPVPVCGDKKCDAPAETYQNCPSDCPAPVPVCGDGKCDAPTETADNCPADCTPPAPTAGVDSDSDGLTDVEETTIYHTNPNNPDTAHRGYIDGNQVVYLYDPASATPHALLKDNPGITVYQNAAQHYSIFRPTSWTMREDVPNNAVYFTAPTTEFMEVLIADKTASQSIMDWYLAQAPTVTSSQVEAFKTLQGYDAVTSPDRMTTYVDFGTHAVVVTYNLGKSTQIQFKSTFQMMVASLKKLP